MIGHRADFVHLPRIFVEFDTDGGGDALAFFDQRVEQMSEVGGFPFGCEVRRVRKFGQSGDAIYRRS